MMANAAPGTSTVGSARYKAPFRPGGANAIDAELARKLLVIALEKGGDYADLFFEYRAGGSFVLDEGILKSVSRGVSIGLGVRVQRGDATGYAYVESLVWDDMARAARTAAQIALGTAPGIPEVPTEKVLPRRYEVSPVSIDVAGAEKRALLERADAAARAYDP